MSVAAWSGSLLDWERELSALKEQLAPVLRRRELKGTGGAFRRTFVGHRTQDWLADGRAGGAGAAVPDAIAFGAQFMVGG